MVRVIVASETAGGEWTAFNSGRTLSLVPGLAQPIYH
jgi:hypothetical protein